MLCWSRKGGNFTTVGRVFFNIYQDFSTFMIQGGGGTPPFGAILPWLLTTLPKLKDVVSFLALDSTVQIDKFKSFFAKLEEEHVCAKTERLFTTKKLDKLEKELEYATITNIL